MAVCCLFCVLPGPGEPANLEAAQREKELLLQKMMELERRLDDHERILEELRSRMTDGGREMETTSAGTWEATVQNGGLVLRSAV